MRQISRYIDNIKAAIGNVDRQVIKISNMISSTKSENGRIWVAGNGGSLAIAQHFAQDLVKACGVRAHALNCPSMITAYSNDEGFEYSYFLQLKTLADPKDILVIFSCSGKSRNYIEFVSSFGKTQNPVIAIVGTDGGFLKDKAGTSVHIRSNDYQVCEAAFCIISDMVVKNLMEGKCRR